jgi:ABC-type transport system involved in cytochrome bd biosynthesis fused ATPase/permease subunit
MGRGLKLEIPTSVSQCLALESLLDLLVRVFVPQITLVSLHWLTVLTLAVLPVLPAVGLLLVRRLVLQFHVSRLATRAKQEVASAQEATWGPFSTPLMR